MRIYTDNAKKKDNNPGLESINNAKYKQLVEHINTVMAQNFTGYIKINFSQGTIGRIEQFQQILKK